MVPLSLANLTTAPTADEWATNALAIMQTLGLPTTAWQPGQPERTITATVAQMQQQADVAATIMIQGGILDFAASGFITYVNAEGATVTQFVTPDPSIPSQNPTGALGWLDVLADSLYDVQRILQTFAGGTLALLNTSVSTYGPFSATTYHVAQPGAPGIPTYANTASLTVPPSTVIGSVTGTANLGGVIKVTVTTHGLSTGATVFLAGVGGTVEANGAWVITVVDANHFTLDGSVFTNAWTSGGTAYTPTLAAFTADNAGSPSSAISANLVTQSVTSLIGVSVSNVDAWIGDDTENNGSVATRCRLQLATLGAGAAFGAYIVYALRAQQLAPRLNPPQKVSAAVTRARPDLDVTQGIVFLTVANAAGGCAGTINNPGTDVYAIQAVEVAYAPITCDTLITRGAVDHDITITLRIYLGSTFNTTANQKLFQAAVLAYVRSLPIGGITDPSGVSPSTNVVPINAVLGAVFDAAENASIPLQDVEGTLDGGSGPVRTNIQLALTPVPEVAVPLLALTDVVLVSV